VHLSKSSHELEPSFRNGRRHRRSKDVLGLSLPLWLLHIALKVYYLNHYIELLPIYLSRALHLHIPYPYPLWAYVRVFVESLDRSATYAETRSQHGRVSVVGNGLVCVRK
jgi:hypothetical protein